MVRDARAVIENLSVEEFDRQREGAVVVDLREAEEWNAYGMIPGAVAISRGMLEFAADPDSPHYKPGLQRDARILLYCQAGARSALAGRTLMEMGYANVAHLSGGFHEWAAAGKPIR
jgi:rhodanese-related sulfurtransferase